MPTHISTSIDTHMEVEALLLAYFFLDSSPINRLDFFLLGMVATQNNRINRPLWILEYAYNTNSRMRLI